MGLFYCLKESIISKNDIGVGMIKNLTVSVSASATWKTKLILFFAKPMCALGFWDFYKVCNMVEKSLKIEIKENF